MSNQAQLAFDEYSHDADLLARLMDRADRILIKKLSNNDRDWARFPNKHQAGVYIPHEQRDGGFFPPLEVKVRKDTDADEIREKCFKTIWPQPSGEEKWSPRPLHQQRAGNAYDAPAEGAVCRPAACILSGHGTDSA